MATFEELEKNIFVWGFNRGLINSFNTNKQALKMVSEVGELCDALAKEDKEKIIDGIGDSLVTIIILCHQLGLSPTECLESAYNEIKDRKGKNVNGTFIKDEA